MITEEDLRAALRTKADHAQPASADALLHVVQAGRPRRPRQLPALAFAALIVIIAALSVTVVQATRTDRDGTTGHPMAGVTVAPTPQYTAQTLIGLLHAAPGTVTNLAGHGGANYAAVTMTYNDGRGGALVYLTLTWPAPTDATGPTITPTGCPHDTTADPASGTQWGTNTLACTTRPDGTQLGTGQPRLPAAPGATYGLALNNVYVLRPDGVEIRVGVFNQPTLSTTTPTGVTRPDVPFSIDSLTAVALSPKWSATVPTAAVKAAQSLFPTPTHSTKNR